MHLLWYYSIGVNVIAFILMGIDKRRAREGKYRISERMLWFWVIVGGAVGGTAGMYYFRHKTKHLNFKIGFPLLALLYVWLLIQWK